MTAKDRLIQLKEHDVYYHRLIREIATLRNDIRLIKGISYGPSSPSGGTRHTEKMIDHIADMETELQAEARKYYRLRKEIIEEIEKLHCNNPAYKEILYLRYVDGLRLTEVAREMNYAYDYIRRAHGKALWIFAEQNGYECKRSHKDTDKQ